MTASVDTITEQPVQMGRRAFLGASALTLAGLGCESLAAQNVDSRAALRIGLLTDIHYADKEPANTRFYRQSIDKMNETVEHFNAANLNFVIELGDLIDAAPSVEQEIEWLKTIEARYARLRASRHYVLGNHCVDTLTKKEFAAHTKAVASHYSFEQGGVQFVVLDACFKEDGTPYARKNFHWQDSWIPAQQVVWLHDLLSKADMPTVVFTHQRLDHDEKHCVKNAGEVRSTLEKHGNVLAVFQGHSHKNDYQEISGIHYTTLVAMVDGQTAEDSGYGMLEILPNTTLRLQGFRKQVSRDFLLQQ